MIGVRTPAEPYMQLNHVQIVFTSKKVIFFLVDLAYNCLFPPCSITTSAKKERELKISF